MKTIQKYLAVALAFAFGSTSAFAVVVPVDLTSLTAQVDLSTVLAAILAVGALLMAPQIAKYAISAIRRMFPK